MTEDDPHVKFGETIAGSRWFNAEPSLTQVEMVPVRQTWICPACDGTGEMISTGGAWLTNPPGYHHTCNKCGFTAALRGGKQYPSISYVRKPGRLGPT